MYVLHSLAALLLTVLMRLAQRLEEVHAEAGNSAAKARQQQVALKECEDKQQAIVQRLKAAREVRLFTHSCCCQPESSELPALH